MRLIYPNIRIWLLIAWLNAMSAALLCSLLKRTENRLQLKLWMRASNQFVNHASKAVRTQEDDHVFFFGIF